MKTGDVLRALRNRHHPRGQAPDGEWVYAEEVRVSTRFSSWRLPGEDTVDRALLGAGEQRIDAFALHTWPSRNGLRIAYEVKVSMSDLRRELAQPWKCAAAMALSNEFYLVVPDDLSAILPLLPAAWGVIRVDADGGTRKTQPAEYRETELPPYSFMLSLARNVQRRHGVEETAYMRLAPDDTPEAMKEERTIGNRYQTMKRTVTRWEPDGEPYEFTERNGEKQ